MQRAARSHIDVSVIIAAYNVDHYLGRAVHSALDQEGVAVEIIIVDDGSTDNTWALATHFNDPRIRCFQLPENKGPSIARNTGIANARGEWIAVLDGDDTFKPARLARCLELAKAKKADAVVDNVLVYREVNGAMFPMFHPAKFSKFNKLTLADFIAGNTSFFSARYSLGYLKPIFSTAFLRDKKLHYDPDMRIGEDYTLLAEVLASGALCVVEHSAGYVYTVRTGSVSHRLSLEDIRRISDGDAKFVSRYMFDAKSAKAQQRRDSGIMEAYRFTLLAHAIKNKDVVGALKITINHPAVARHIWRPVWVRVNRLFHHTYYG